MFVTSSAARAAERVRRGRRTGPPGPAKALQGHFHAVREPSAPHGVKPPFARLLPDTDIIRPFSRKVQCRSHRAPWSSRIPALAAGPPFCTTEARTARVRYGEVHPLLSLPPARPRPAGTTRAVFSGRFPAGPRRPDKPWPRSSPQAHRNIPARARRPAALGIAAGRFFFPLSKPAALFPAVFAAVSPRRGILFRAPPRLWGTSGVAGGFLLQNTPPPELRRGRLGLTGTPSGCRRPRHGSAGGGRSAAGWCCPPPAAAWPE